MDTITVNCHRRSYQVTLGRLVQGGKVKNANCITYSCAFALTKSFLSKTPIGSMRLVAWLDGQVSLNEVSSHRGSQGALCSQHVTDVLGGIVSTGGCLLSTSRKNGLCLGMSVVILYATFIWTCLLLQFGFLRIYFHIIVLGLRVQDDFSRWCGAL